VTHGVTPAKLQEYFKTGVVNRQQAQNYLTGFGFSQAQMNLWFDGITMEMKHDIAKARIGAVKHEVLAGHLNEVQADVELNAIGIDLQYADALVAAWLYEQKGATTKHVTLGQIKDELARGVIDLGSAVAYMQNLGLDNDAIGAWIFQAQEERAKLLTQEEHQIEAAQKKLATALRERAALVKQEEVKQKHIANIIKNLQVAAEKSDELQAIADTTANFADQIVQQPDKVLKQKLRDQLKSALADIKGILAKRIASEVAQVQSLPPP
jgi:hypothetical protein